MPKNNGKTRPPGLSAWRTLMVFSAQIQQQACKLVSPSAIAPTRQSCTVGCGRISLPVGALCALKWLPFAFYGSPVGNGFVFAPGSVAYFYRSAWRVRIPLFLLHWTVSIVVSAWLFHGLASTDMRDPREGARYCAVVLVASIGCSLVFYRLIDRPTEHVRQRIRQRTRKAGS